MLLLFFVFAVSDAAAGVVVVVVVVVVVAVPDAAGEVDCLQRMLTKKQKPVAIDCCGYRASNCYCCCCC